MRHPLPFPRALAYLRALPSRPLRPCLPRCAMALALVAALALPATLPALVPSLFGPELDELWRDYYHRAQPQGDLIVRVEAFWPRTLDMATLDRLREQTHLRFMQGMIEQDRERWSDADKYLVQAEATWKEWLALEPHNGRTRVVGVEIKSLRLLGGGFWYAITNALSLDSDLQQALKDAPLDPRVQIIGAMKFHYLPGIAGGSLDKAIGLLRNVPQPPDPQTDFLLHYELALCLEAKGKKDEARTEIDRCLALYPQSFLALKVVERLNKKR